MLWVLASMFAVICCAVWFMFVQMNPLWSCHDMMMPAEVKVSRVGWEQTHNVI